MTAGLAGSLPRLGLLLLLAAPASSCIDLAGDPAKSAADVSVVAQGSDLTATCTPTGVEICFDARDNNCNGIIDEGCGLHTGILQFVIAWEAPDVDVDLNVTDPTGDVAKLVEPTASGLLKDRDCPRAECQGQNVENVYLAEGEPRKGDYKVAVHLEKLNGATAPVRVRLGVRFGRKTFGTTVELSPGAATEERSFTYTVK